MAQPVDASLSHSDACERCCDLEHGEILMNVLDRVAELVWTSTLIVATVVFLATGHPEYTFPLTVLFAVLRRTGPR